MHKQIAILARPFVIVAVMALGPLACTDDAGTDTAPAPLTGTWDGGFTTDNAAVAMGNFTFVITEDAAHAISGTFTGMAASQSLAGTITGKRAGARLEGTVNVATPIMLTLSFPDAAIAEDTIAGDFSIAAPISAKGKFTVTRK